MTNGADVASLQGDFNIRLAMLETRIDTILPTLATKADIGDTKAAIAAASRQSLGLLRRFPLQQRLRTRLL